jgi:predicted CXXCH cytochrome family protein
LWADGKQGLLLAALLALCFQGAGVGVVQAGADIVAIEVKALLPKGDAGGHMTSAQCAGCHRIDPVLSHPVLVSPTMAIPAEFPLEGGGAMGGGGGGQMNCTTCHRDTIAEHAAARDALLRGTATGQAFCAQCHTQQTITRQSRHPFAISQAHLLWPAEARGVSSNQANAAANPRDDGVNSCLSCHDGAIAPDAFAGIMAAPGAISSGTPRKGHPVGITYPVTLRRGDTAFKSAPDPRIRLTGMIGGGGAQVTCNSCHSLYSTQPGLLVIRNDRSGLCTSCHVR